MGDDIQEFWEYGALSTSDSVVLSGKTALPSRSNYAGIVVRCARYHQPWIFVHVALMLMPQAKSEISACILSTSAAISSSYLKNNRSALS
jgi:hypothetical protein